MKAPRQVQTGSNEDLPACMYRIFSLGNVTVLLILFSALLSI